MNETFPQPTNPSEENEHTTPDFSERSLEFHPNFEVATFTAGKKPPRNEDTAAVGANYLIIADGATDKSGLQFETDPITGTYKTGGEIASSIATSIAATSDKTGADLIQEITAAVRAYYTDHNPEALTDSAYRFATTLIAARVVGDTLIVTQVGDSFFRINGTVYANNKTIDTIRANERIQKIHELAKLHPDGRPTEADILAGREAIQDGLNKQHLLQNNVNDPLGYGVLDGAEVPGKFIKVYEFPIESIAALELVSDGYYGAFPDEATISAWEAVHRYQLETDPYNIGKFPSTKGSSNGRPGDDRSVIIARRIDQ